MATTTAFITKQNNPQVRSGVATIDSGETASLPVYCGGRAVVRLSFPAAFTGTAVSFTVQPYPPANPASPLVSPAFTTLTRADGTTVSYVVAASKTINVPELAGAYAFTIVSNASEGAGRAVDVQCVGPYPMASSASADLVIESGTVIATQGTSPWVDSVAPTSAATSNGYGSPTTVTRPANATPYSANDVVGGAIDLGVMGPSAGAIILTSARLEPHIAAVPSGMTSFTLYLYNVTPPSAIADNGAFTLATADLSAYLGQIALGSPVLPAAGSNSLAVEVSNLGKQVLLAGTHLFGYLVTAGGFTPAGNSEIYVVTTKAVAV